MTQQDYDDDDEDKENIPPNRNEICTRESTDGKDDDDESRPLHNCRRHRGGRVPVIREDLDAALHQIENDLSVDDVRNNLSRLIQRRIMKKRRQSVEYRNPNASNTLVDYDNEGELDVEHLDESVVEFIRILTDATKRSMRENILQMTVGTTSEEERALLESFDFEQQTNDGEKGDASSDSDSSSISVSLSSYDGGEEEEEEEEFDEEDLFDHAAHARAQSLRQEVREASNRILGMQQNLCTRVMNISSRHMELSRPPDIKHNESSLDTNAPDNSDEYLHSLGSSIHRLASQLRSIGAALPDRIDRLEQTIATIERALQRQKERERAHAQQNHNLKNILRQRQISHQRTKSTHVSNDSMDILSEKDGMIDPQKRLASMFSNL